MGDEFGSDQGVNVLPRPASSRTSKNHTPHRLYNLVKDGDPHRADEIIESVDGSHRLGCARIGARIYHVQKKYRLKINGWHDPGKYQPYWHQIVGPSCRLPSCAWRLLSASSSVAPHWFEMRILDLR